MRESRSWPPRRGPKVVGAGALNGLGFNTEQTWAFWRADLTPFRPSPFRTESGERATMASVEVLPPKLFDVDRAGALMDGALRDLRQSMGEWPASLRVSFYHVVSERFAADGPRRALQRWTTQWLDETNGGGDALVLPLGHAGLAPALLRAASALEGDLVDLAIVGGTDTYYGPSSMARLIRERRVFDGIDMDTIIPGEGAAFLALATDATAERLRLEPWAELWCLAVDEEPHHMNADAPCTGAGLTGAMRGVTGWMKSDRRRLRWLLGDVTNEVYRTHEFGLAMPRSIAPGGLDTAGADYFEILHEEFEHDFLPECFGDLGAATMPTAAVIAAETMRRGHPTRDHCLVVGSSVGPTRGAVLVGRHGGRAR